MSSKGGKQYSDIEEMTAVEYIRELAVGAYMLALFVVLPLILKDKYRMLGTFKYEVFRWISMTGLGIILLTEVSVLVMSWKKKSHQRKNQRNNKASDKKLKIKMQDFWRRLSLTDRFVAGYGICVIISFLLSVDKAEALWGAAGWYMGLVSQLIFVVSYFVVSRWWSGGMRVWYAACGVAFVVFLLGVLHRFSVDPFGLYEGLSESTIKQYLSLLGQNTWYSSYMCTVFPLGLYLFWGTKELWLRLAGGLFSAVGFASWVTQNSDSAYIALTLMLLALFLFGFTSNVWMERFLEVLLLMLFSFVATGFLQDLFPEQAVLPEALSLFFSRSIVMIIFFIIICICYILLLLGEKKGMEISAAAWVGRAVVILFAAAVLLGILFIILNSKGYLAEWFGYTNENNYLLFNGDWGNGRGKTWKYSAGLVKELPFYRKLFGVGPDCFAFYSYHNPVYEEQLLQMWGDSTLTNAHCEWLNGLICYGLAGILCYIGIFVSAVVRFFKAGKKSPIFIAIVLCLVAYTGHNIFCYQQALCTPFVFVILGMGERIWQFEAE
ncbi:MAG: hypothetical protein GX234_11500 [Clostridiales bacterium]|nr:hypothetical protein [Clostridiales bacterium]